jgi:hypothetical protein
VEVRLPLRECYEPLFYFMDNFHLKF